MKEIQFISTVFSWFQVGKEHESFYFGSEKDLYSSTSSSTAARDSALSQSLCFTLFTALWCIITHRINNSKVFGNTVDFKI